MRTRLVVSCLVVILTTVPSQAETPLGTTFTYQGQLKNSGSPASGSFNMVFRLFDALTLGNQVGPTLTFDGAGGNPPPISVTDGLFIVPIDFGAAAFGGNKRWLSITVGGTTLTPRQELNATPNALNADKLDGLNSSAFLQSIPVPLTLTGTSNNWLLKAENATTAAGASSINGTSTGATGGTYGGYFLNSSTSGTGVLGLSNAPSGTTHGVRGQCSSTDGYGVRGAAIAASGVNYGVYGTSASTSGYGVLGESVDNIGVRGNATGTTGVNYGVYAQSASESGRAVFAWATAVTGNTYGGWFQNASVSGLGVLGKATAATGMTTGVYGQSDSSTGRGVYGRATGSGLFSDTYGGRFESTNGTGVYGYSGEGTYGGQFECDSTFGRAVYGLANAATGAAYGGEFYSNSASGRAVYARASSATGSTYGVYGSESSPDGYAIFANGDMGGSGFKSFRIDHPFDPENKYLLHYAAESPMPQNFYVGNVTTDANGNAWVELPDYFAEINTNFKYQLTVVDGPSSGENDFIQVKVRQKIKDGRFLIRTSAPNVEVSWEIKADRNDLYIRRKQPKDVVEKRGLEKGTYQHPELYGQPTEKGIDYDADHERPSPAAAPDATSN